VRPPKLIPGPALLGFADLFDGAYGDPKTRAPYPLVTPSSLSGVLLPFPCPHCGDVRPEMVDPKKRAGYSDPERCFFWCPTCRGRYVLSSQGMPLAEGLPAGATAAPARIERRGGKVEMLAPSVGGALHLLGAHRC